MKDPSIVNDFQIANPPFPPLAATSSGDGISPAAIAAASGSPPGSAAATWTTFAGRSPGSFSRQRCIIPSTAGSISRTMPDKRLGDTWSRMRTSSAMDPARNTGFPVNISCRVRPNEYMSECSPTAPPASCSGDMYAGVPTILPRSLADSARRARPKSVIRTLPRPSIMMLDGLRSRCTTPFSCAAYRPPHIWRANSTPLSVESRPIRRRRLARSSPSTNSIERKWCPSTSPTSYTRHTFGCDTVLASRTSL